MSERRYQTYGVYGNVAYVPEFEGNTVREPERRRQEEPAVQPRRRIRERPQIRVREAERVSPLGVVGFLAVGVFAVLVLLSYVRLTTLSDSAVSLRSGLTELQKEESKLLARYELSYDLHTIEETVTADGSMVKPQSTQVYVIDLAEPDSAELFREKSPVEGLREKVSSVLKKGTEYFK